MEIKIPYKFTPREYQLPFLRAMDSGIKRAVLVWHRRSGKDKTAWNFMIKRALEERGNYYYFLPTGALARQVIWDNIDNDGFKTIEHCPTEIIKNMNSTEMMIELVNGSTIKLIGSDKFEKRAIGTNPRGIVFSEYSVTEPQVWNYVRPILAANKKAWAVFIFTPRGVNHGWKLLQQAKTSEKWFTQILTVADTGAMDDDVLEEEKQQMPLDLYEQEYNCKFVEGAGAFFRRVEENIWEGNLIPAPNLDYRLGVDLAKYRDFTVITPICLQTHKVGKPDRFNQVDWNLQKSRIENIYHRFFKPMIRLDSTGLGDPIHDDLLNQGMNVEGFKFTEQSRYELLNNLRILIEQDKIKIPNDTQLLDELRSFQYSMGSSTSGKPKLKIQVPEGTHDDCVMSLALAVWELGGPILPKATGIARMLETREQHKKEINIE